MLKNKQETFISNCKSILMSAYYTKNAPFMGGKVNVVKNKARVERKEGSGRTEGGERKRDRREYIV